MNLIVAEDDPMCLKFIEEALRPICEYYKHADNLQDLLPLLDTDPDVIWLDLMMPLFPGSYEAVNLLERIPLIRTKCPEATLLVVTGHGPQYKEQAIAYGADVYAEKQELRGFSKGVLIDLVSRAAMSAIDRGVRSQKVYKTVSDFVANLAKHDL